MLNFDRAEVDFCDAIVESRRAQSVIVSTRALAGKMTASSFSCQSFERNFKDTEKEPVSQIFHGNKIWNKAFFLHLVIFLN